MIYRVAETIYNNKDLLTQLKKELAEDEILKALPKSIFKSTMSKVWAELSEALILHVLEQKDAEALQLV